MSEEFGKEYFLGLENAERDLSPIERALLSLWLENGYEITAMEAAAELAALREQVKAKDALLDVVYEDLRSVMDSANRTTGSPWDMLNDVAKYAYKALFAIKKGS